MWKHSRFDLDGKEATREVEEDRRGETERIDAVEDARVTFHERSVVFYAAISFDCRHRYWGVGVHGLAILGLLWMGTPHNFYPEKSPSATVSRWFQGSARGILR